MRIFHSKKETPMLLDSLSGMRANYEYLMTFLQSAEWATTLEADCNGTAEPYDELLLGLIVEKSKGPIKLSITPNKWLNLSGSVENLAHYIGHFEFRDDEEGEHHHPEHMDVKNYISSDSLSLIIEVDTDLIEQSRIA